MIQFNLDQINPTRVVELVGQAITLAGFIWGLFKKGMTALRVELNTIITDNVNRGTSEAIAEMKAYTDKKFSEHEESAFGRIEGLEKALGVNNGNAGQNRTHA